MFENRIWGYCRHHSSAVFNVCSVFSICRKILGDACAPSTHTKQRATIATGKTRECIGSFVLKKRSLTKTASYTCVTEELEYPMKRREFSQEGCFVAITRCVPCEQGFLQAGRYGRNPCSQGTRFEKLGNFLRPLHLVLINYLRNVRGTQRRVLPKCIEKTF